MATKKPDDKAAKDKDAKAGAKGKDKDGKDSKDGAAAPDITEFTMSDELREELDALTGHDAREHRQSLVLAQRTAENLLHIVARAQA